MRLSFASRSLPPYIALTTSNISRGGVKINVSCYMTKLDFFDHDPCSKKWFPHALIDKNFITRSLYKDMYWLLLLCNLACVANCVLSVLNEENDDDDGIRSETRRHLYTFHNAFFYRQLLRTYTRGASAGTRLLQDTHTTTQPQHNILLLLLIIIIVVIILHDIVKAVHHRGGRWSATAQRRPRKIFREE